MSGVRKFHDVLDPESQTRWALRRVADGIEVSDVDVMRLEREFVGGRSGRRSPRMPQRQSWLVVACSLLALAVALGALSAVDRQPMAPTVASPSASTSAPLAGTDLVGIWRVEADAYPVVWVMRANGELAVWFSPEDLQRTQTGLGSTYQLTGDVLTFVWSDSCSSSWKVTAPAPGRLRVERVSGGSCGPFNNWWATSDLIRVVPTAGAVPPKFQGGSTEPVRRVSALQGTWLLAGTGRLLVVDEDARYIVSDNAESVDDNGRLPLVERGTAEIEADGSIVFTPKGENCLTTYAIVRTDYATMDARLAQDSCGRLGGAADTWIRLN